MKGTVQYEVSSFDAFNIHNGVKQGCVLVPTLFRIFLAGSTCATDQTKSVQPFTFQG
jgi:hypothetical protein